MNDLLEQVGSRTNGFFCEVSCMFKEETGSIKAQKDMPKWVKKKITRPQSYMKNYRQLRNTESKRNCLAREDHTHWLLNIKYLKTYVEAILYR